MSTQSTTSDNLAAEKGSKVLKTNVKVQGKFVLSPDEAFNAMVARQLIDKAKGNGVSVSTELKVFEHGVQLGERAAFVGMPIEFIKYHRISGMTSLTNEPSTLVLCIRDYDQRWVIVMRLSDAVSLKVVMDVIHKRHAIYTEKVTRLSQSGSIIPSRRIPPQVNRNRNINSGLMVERDYTDAPVDGYSGPREQTVVEVSRPNLPTNGTVGQSAEQHYPIVRSRPLLSEQSKVTSSTLQLEKTDEERQPDPPSQRANGQQQHIQHEEPDSPSHRTNDQQQHIQHQQSRKLPRTRMELQSGVNNSGDYLDDGTWSEMFSSSRSLRPIARVTDSSWVAGSWPDAFEQDGRYHKAVRHGTTRLTRTSVRP